MSSALLADPISSGWSPGMKHEGTWCSVIVITFSVHLAVRVGARGLLSAYKA